MAPISTLIISTALCATAPTSQVQLWSDDQCIPNLTEPTFKLKDTSTIFLLITDNSIDQPSEKKISEYSSGSLSPKELLMREMLSYQGFDDGWNGDGSIAPTDQAIFAATEFILKIPSHLPLPRPMLSFDGEIGLYWGLDGGYAEVTFESAEDFTFFSRSNNGEEIFDETLNLTTLSDNWFWKKIGIFDLVSKIA